MFITLLHNDVPPGADLAEADVLVQAAAIRGALLELGHSVRVFGVTADLGPLQAELREHQPEVVFNLIESLAGSDRLGPMVPIVLESLGIPFTGSPADALYVAGSKRLTKARLEGLGLPTPPAVWEGEVQRSGGTAFEPGRYLLKSVHEHASFALDDEAVVELSTAGEAQAALAERRKRFGKPFFAERYISGREFNVGVLESPDGGPRVLPIAEIEFVGFADERPRIVGYAAKWEVDSQEYLQTLRQFVDPGREAALLSELAQLTEAVWGGLGLSGYARVDFRVDGSGQPWILEANANPCLSPDAGFAAAAEQAGMSYGELIQRILQAAVGGDVQEKNVS